MKRLLSTSIAVFFVACGVNAIPCNRTCELEDEFVDNPDPTAWDTFMDKLEEFTFNDRFLACFDSNGEVRINASSDVIWDMRFKLYSTVTDERSRYLDDCYCRYQDCASADFKQCLVSARNAMTLEVNEMGEEISQLMMDMMFEC